MTVSFSDLVLSMPLTDEMFDRLCTIKNRAHLYQNRALTKYQWSKLWHPKLSATDASWLVERPLDAEQVEQVLSTERRSGVLLVLFRRGLLSAEQQRQVISTTTSSTLLTQVMPMPTFAKEHLPLAASRLTGRDRLEWCAAHGPADVDDTEMLAALTTLAATEHHPREMRSLNALASKVCNARPNLVTDMVDDQAIRALFSTPLAGSRHLLDVAVQTLLVGDPSTTEEYTALAFVANPVADRSLVESFTTHSSERVRAAARSRLEKSTASIAVGYESVVDPEQLAWLLRRALPNQYRIYGRPGDLVALAMNPNLTTDDARKVFVALRDTPAQEVRAEQMDEARTHLASRLGIEAPQAQLELGFWIADPHRYEYREVSEQWLVDPTRRPWTPGEIEEAYTLSDEWTRSKILNSDLAVLCYNNHTVVHVVCLQYLGTDPGKWEMAVNLSHTHRGSLEKLLRAASLLTRS